MNALWLNASPSLSTFDHPLLRELAKRIAIAKWQYNHEPDEPCSLEIAMTLLHDYLKSRGQPIHLLGHGLSGTLALLYARRYPERVRSLTLLAVAEQPAVTWHAHYYVQRHLLPCSQACILAQMAQQLFKGKRPYPAADLVNVLQKDLVRSPLLHSLVQVESLPVGGVEVPLLICGAADDGVVHPPLLKAWQTWLAASDRLWLCPEGGHFFHFFQAALVSREISKFWAGLGQTAMELESFASTSHL